MFIPHSAGAIVSVDSPMRTIFRIGSPIEAAHFIERNSGCVTTETTTTIETAGTFPLLSLAAGIYLTVIPILNRCSPSASLAVTTQETSTRRNKLDFWDSAFLPFIELQSRGTALSLLFFFLSVYCGRR